MARMVRYPHLALTPGTGGRKESSMTRLLAIFIVLAALATATVAYAAHPKFEATLSGAAEVPPRATDGSGSAKFASHGEWVSFKLRWADLTTPAFAAHIH